MDHIDLNPLLLIRCLFSSSRVRSGGVNTASNFKMLLFGRLIWLNGILIKTVLVTKDLI